MMTLRKSYNYKTVVRNVNRCFNSDVSIDLFYDTYVNNENHKLSFFCHGPLLGGGEETVSQATRDFEAQEINIHFYKVKASPRVYSNKSLAIHKPPRPGDLIMLLDNGYTILETLNKANTMLYLYFWGRTGNCSPQKWVKNLEFQFS